MDPASFMLGAKKKGKKVWRRVGFEDEVSSKPAVAASPQVSSGSTAVADGGGASTAVASTAVADDAEDDDRQSMISVQSGSTCAGDSVFGDDEGQGETPPPASHRLQEREDRRRDETAPQERITNANDQDSSVVFGNIGLLFGNWGRPPAHAQKKPIFLRQSKDCLPQSFALRSAQLKAKRLWKSRQ